jgi:hypothetical protein
MTMPSQIARQRLFDQRIAGRRFKRPADVVAWMGVVQAQDYLGALWAIGLRMRTAVEGDIERALAEGSIVRTWPMRGTLHFVAAADVRWMLDLLAPRTISARAGRHRDLELVEADFTRSRKAVARALRDGRRLPRDAMYRVLESAGVSAAGQRGIHVLGRLALDGLICFGPRDGKQHTFTLLAEWVPSAKPKPRDESLAELARRYFTSHGPATVQDFAWWSGLPLLEARKALGMVESQLARESVDGRDFWYSPAEAATLKATPEAYLLPAFDEFLVGYTDRSAALRAQNAQSVNNGGGILSPTIVVDGQVVGTWKRALKRNAVTVTPTLFAQYERIPASRMRDAAERYGAFLGLAAEIAEVE